MDDSLVLAIAVKSLDSNKMRPSSVDSIINYALHLKEIAQRRGYIYQQMRISTWLGKTYFEKGDYAKALYSFEEIFTYPDTRNNHFLLARTYQNIGAIHLHKGETVKAASFFQKALFHYHIDQENVNEELLGSIYNNYAILFKGLRQYEKAIQYFSKVLDGSATLKAKVSTLSGIGMAYLELNKDSQAVRYLDSAIKMSRKHSLQLNLHASLINLAKIKFKHRKYKECLDLLNEAQQLQSQYLINPNEKNILTGNLGLVNIRLENFDEAKFYLEKAIQVKDMIPYEKKVILGQLSELYLKAGDYSKAYDYQKSYYQLSDSIQNKEVILQVAELEAKYQNAEKEKLLVVQKNQIYKMNVLIWSIILIIFSLIVVVIGLYIYKQKKRKRVQELDRWKAIVEGEEKERSRLSKELHDGVNSQLTAVKLHLSALKEKISEPHNIDNVETIENMLLAASSTVRRVAHNLSPNDLMNNGLSVSIQEFCQNLFYNTAVHPEVVIYENVDHIASDLALSTYRIIQELLTNVVKHADATKVILIVFKDDTHLHVLVEDNGRGFNVDETGVVGMGLSSVRERVASHNGVCQFSAKKESKGTVVNITFPLNESL